MVANQLECFRFEQRSVVNLWLSTKHVRFIEEWVMFIKKHDLVQKIFTNGLNIYIATISLCQKDCGNTLTLG